MLSAVSPTVAHTYTGTGNSGSAEEHCTLQRLVFIVPLAPNAQAEARATRYNPTPATKRTLWPVASSAVLGGWRPTRAPPPPQPWPQAAATPGASSNAGCCDAEPRSAVAPPGPARLPTTVLPCVVGLALLRHGAASCPPDRRPPPPVP